MRVFRFAAAIALAFAGSAQATTIEEVLLDAMIEKGAPGDGAISIVGRLPAGLDPELVTVTAVNYDAPTGRFGARMKLVTGRTLTVQGKVEAGADVPVLNRALRVGDIVSPDDVVYMRVAESRLARGTITDAAALIGMSAKRQLRAGLALRDVDFAKPLIVRKGDTVTMVFRAEGIELTARGKAMSNGGRGDTVAVVNVQSLKQVDAVVTGTGAVSVSPQILAVN
jgi:flagella basal body P-ring formation protein FlgA